MAEATCWKCGKRIGGLYANDLFPLCPECKQVELLEKQQKEAEKEAEKQREFEREQAAELARQREWEAARNREHAEQLARRQEREAEKQREFEREQAEKQRAFEQEQADKNRKHAEQLEARRREEEEHRQIQEDGKPTCHYCGIKYTFETASDCYLEYCSKKCACDDLGAANLGAYLARRDEIVEKHIIEDIRTESHFRRAVYWSHVPGYCPSKAVYEAFLASPRGYELMLSYKQVYEFNNEFDLHIGDHEWLSDRRNEPSYNPYWEKYDFTPDNKIYPNSKILFNLIESGSHPAISYFLKYICRYDFLLDLSGADKAMNYLLNSANTDDTIASCLFSLNSHEILGTIISKIKDGEYEVNNSEMLTKLQKKYDELIEKEYIDSDDFQTVYEGISKIKDNEYPVGDSSVLTHLQEKYDDLIERKYINSDDFQTVYEGISKIKDNEYPVGDSSVLTRLQNRYIELKYIHSSDFQEVNEGISKIKDHEFTVDASILTRLQERHDTLVQNLIQKIENSREKAKTLDDYLKIIAMTKRLLPLKVEGAEDVLHDYSKRALAEYISSFHFVKRRAADELVNYGLPAAIFDTIEPPEDTNYTFIEHQNKEQIPAERWFSSGYNFVNNALKDLEDYVFEDDVSISKEGKAYCVFFRKLIQWMISDENTFLYKIIDNSKKNTCGSIRFIPVYYLIHCCDVGLNIISNADDADLENELAIQNATSAACNALKNLLKDESEDGFMNYPEFLREANKLITELKNKNKDYSEWMARSLVELDHSGIISEVPSDLREIVLGGSTNLTDANLYRFNIYYTKESGEVFVHMAEEVMKCHRDALRPLIPECEKRSLYYGAGAAFWTFLLLICSISREISISLMGMIARLVDEGKNITSLEESKIDGARLMIILILATLMFCCVYPFFTSIRLKKALEKCVEAEEETNQGEENVQE